MSDLRTETAGASPEKDAAVAHAPISQAPEFEVIGAPKGQLRILQLYPEAMNIYGDWGNTLTVARRAGWHGYEPVLLEYNPGDEFPQDVDIVLGGGGQDSGQVKILQDLGQIAPTLKDWSQEGVPMLMICGMYQLFGHSFLTHTGARLEGVGIFDLDTLASEERLIGNIVTESERFGTIIGYENHSGKTTLHTPSQALGKVLSGAGNNGADELEGAMVANTIGTYMHGSLLPKNPKIADFLIEQAAIRRYGSFEPGTLDDSAEEAARTSAAARPR